MYTTRNKLQLVTCDDLSHRFRLVILDLDSIALVARSGRDKTYMDLACYPYTGNRNADVLS